VVESYGRVPMRRLAYASDATASLSSSLDTPPRLCRLPSHAPAIEAGDPSSPPAAGPSVVVKRRAKGGMQTYVPRRYLCGSLPDALLETHRFWQSDEDGHLVADAVGADGEGRRGVAQGSRAGPSHAEPPLRGHSSEDSPTRGARGLSAVDDDSSPSDDAQPALIVRLAFHQTGGGVAALVRRPAAAAPQAALSSSQASAPGALVLVPLLCARAGSPLESLRALLMRLDNLSHVLVWADEDGSLVRRDGWRVRQVELPRLGLTFIAREAATPASRAAKPDSTPAKPSGRARTAPPASPFEKGILDGGSDSFGRRLYCAEHPQLFISDARPPAVARLLRGLPHALLLQDDYGALHVLLPATARPVWVHEGGGPKALLLRRDDDAWIASLGSTKHHLCAVHPSGALLTPPSLAAALHLLLVKALHRMYAEACELAGCCAHDGTLSAEEAQLVGALDLVALDPSPDAYALRLRLCLALRATSCEGLLPWTAAEQLPPYVALWPRVSASCRLALAEELLLLRAAADAAAPLPPPPLLLHRAMLLQAAAAANAAATAPSALWLPAPAVAEPLRAVYFDTRLELRFEEGASGGGRASSGASPGDEALPGAMRLRERDWTDRLVDAGWGFWTPPEDATGLAALERFNTLFSAVSLRGSFLLVYSLLCGHVQLRLLASDAPHQWGALLVALLPQSELVGGGLLMETLRLLLRSPELGHLAPALEPESADEKKSKALLARWLGGSGAERKERFLAGVRNLQIEEARLVLAQRRYAAGLAAGLAAAGGSSPAPRGALPPPSPRAQQARPGRRLLRCFGPPRAAPPLATSPPQRTTRGAAALAPPDTGGGEEEVDDGGWQPAALVRVPDHYLLREVALSDLSAGPARLVPSQRPGAALALGAEEVSALASAPLGALAAGAVEQRTAAERRLAPLSAEIPFDISRHPTADSDLARATVRRLQRDMRAHAAERNASVEPRLRALDEEAVRKVGAAQGGGGAAAAAEAAVRELRSALLRQLKADSDAVASAVPALERFVNGSCEEPAVGAEALGRWRASRSLLLCGGGQLRLTLPTLLRLLLSSTAEAQLRPLLGTQAAAALNALVGLMLRTNRLAHARRCLAACDRVMGHLSRAPGWEGQSDQLGESANSLAAALCERRHCRTYAPLGVHPSLGSPSRASAGIAGGAGPAGGPIGAGGPGGSGPGGPADAGLGVELEPRILLLEYCGGLLLRKEQVKLLRTFLGDFPSAPRRASTSGTPVTHTGGVPGEGLSPPPLLSSPTVSSAPRSLCHQLLMGAGKTTVIAPLLTLMLADGSRLVMLVVPASLLHFSRSVFRSPLSTLLQRPTFEFCFERGAAVDAALLARLSRAVAERGAVLAAPSAVKSFILKFLELSRERAAMGPGAAQSRGLLGLSAGLSAGRGAAAEAVSHQLRLSARVLRLWREGALVLDEVDWLLHPLKAELNWPLGQREPLDFAKSSLGAGVRWQLPLQLLDGLFLALHGSDSRFAPPSADALAAAEALRAAIEAGRREHEVQLTPHFVLLSRPFYEAAMLPHLAAWAVEWLRKMGVALSPQQLTAYVSSRSPLASEAAASAQATAPPAHSSPRRTAALDAAAADAAAAELRRLLTDDQFKLLNLTRDWLTSLLPHVLAKASRVGYGLLAPRDLSASAPVARRLLAVPFVGKDCPSASSQFSHPDVAIGLTILAYRYERLRRTDFARVMRQLKTELNAQIGPFKSRPASLTFSAWVGAAGGRVRGVAEGSGGGGTPRAHAQAAPHTPVNPRAAVSHATPATAAPPRPAALSGSPFDDAEEPLEFAALHLLELADAEQMEPLFELLRGLPTLARHYLERFVFPQTMSFSSLKLSASGQELGGAIAFGRRLGFSGTPSDLLPEDLGAPYYEPGDDARMVRVLTDTAAMGLEVLADGWDARAVLRRAARATPPRHALIDSGALVTGLSNAAAAAYLLEQGLAGCDACVYLDKGRKLVLRRGEHRAFLGAGEARPEPLLLERCGVPPERRFVFFDHIHTTGTDIELPPHARAALTLSKDVTFRDLAQGAFRMRRVGLGQRVTLLVPPEIAKLVRQHAALGRGEAPSPAALPASPSQRAPLASEEAGEEGAREAGAAETASFLRDACAWAVINGLAGESLQLARLCQQSLRDVWRVAALRPLLASAEAPPTDAEAPQRLGRLMDVFCERLSSEVANSVPAVERTADVLDREARIYGSCLAEGGAALTGSEREALVRLRARALSCAGGEGALAGSGVTSLSAAAAERELVAEVVAEGEAEQEVEQTHEQLAEEELAVAPTEDFPRELWARDLLPPKRWPLAGLRSPCGEGPGPLPFYPAKRFCSSKMAKEGVAPLRLPEFVLLSSNLAPLAHAGGRLRRLKNISLTLDWMPDREALRTAQDPLGSSPLTAKQEARLREAFAMFDLDGDGRLDRTDLLGVLRAVDVDLAAAQHKLAAARPAGGGLLGRVAAAVAGRPAESAAADEVDPEEVPAVEQVLGCVSTDADGRASFEQLRHAVQTHAFYRLRTGRFLVALSLPEAEALRAALHAAARSGGALGAAPLSELCLRHEGRLLDGTPGFVDGSVLEGNEGPSPLVAGKDYLGAIGEQIFRFLDSALQYEPAKAELLLRALQANEMEHRREAFSMVRHCRRRRHADWRQHSVARLFTTEDEYQLLHLRAMLARARRLLRRRRLSPVDFFALCDCDRDAHVSWSELYAGLRWIGLALDQDHAHELFLFLRRGSLLGEAARAAAEGPLLLSQSHFLGAVEADAGALAEWHDDDLGGLDAGGEEAEPEVSRTATAGDAAAIEQLAVLAEESKQRSLPVLLDGSGLASAGLQMPLQPTTPQRPGAGGPALPAGAPPRSALRVQLARVSDFESVWDSADLHGGPRAARAQGSVWAPLLRNERLLSAASVRVCLGHYASAALLKPSRGPLPLPRTVEVVDTRQSRWRLQQDTGALETLVAAALPPPVRYTLRWSKRGGGGGARELYAWEGVPPPGHVALGMLCTAESEPPPLEAMRCVPLAWVRKATAPPIKVWDDSGSSGARGSIWVVNSLGLLAVVPGHDPPAGTFYEPALEAMFAGDEELGGLGR